VIALSKPQPSVAGFLAFCESKDPKEEYKYTNPHQCACAQYARSIDRYESWRSPRDVALWHRLDGIAQLERFAPSSRTFGELAERLRAVACVTVQRRGNDAGKV